MVKMDYLKAFLVEGLICVVGQFLIDKTKLTSAKVLVLFVTLGAVLQGLGYIKSLLSLPGRGQQCLCPALVIL